jgi:hypothetical protein
MNERIQELAEQARQYANSMYPSGLDIPKWGPAYHQKFAELIVRECIGIVKQRWINPDEDVIAEEIKQHFGVEE